MRFLFAVLLAAPLSISGARAGSVALELNEVGVAGLEQMLDIARRSGPSIRDADMAVSLYNALQAAKAKSAQFDAQRLDALEKKRKDLEEQIAALRAEVEKLKNPPTPPEPKDPPQ